MAPPDDSEVRREAVQTTASILLRAPAGSGKTTVLVQRLLVLLTRVAKPEQVLAITFTRKAAAEMRERVLQAFAVASGAQLPADDANENQQRTFALAADTLQHANRLGWDLTTNPARLRIQTIESLNHWIAAQLPASSGAGGGEIAEKPVLLYREAARIALEQAATDPVHAASLSRLLRLVDNRWQTLETQIAALLPERHRWWRHLASGSADELATQIGACLAQMSVAPLRRAHRLLGPDWLARASVVLRDTASARIAAGDRSSDWRSWALEKNPPAPEPQELSRWRLIGRRFLTDKSVLRQRFIAEKGLPGVAPEHKSQIQELAAALQLLPDATAVLSELRDLPDPVLSENNRTALLALRTVLPLAAEALEELMSSRGLSDLVAISGRARQALVSDSESTDLALRLGESLDHILVDEFQDTSIEQFELLQTLTRDWTAGDGRSVLLVGDPMQSIYGFRDAEVALFLRARDRGLGDLRLKSLELRRNFRSLPAIVEFVNRSFGRLLPEQDDIRSGVAAFAGAVAAKTTQGAGEVRFHLLAQSAETSARCIEARRIAALISEIRRTAPVDSIAVLTQTRGNVLGLTETLRQQGWPVRGVKMVALEELPCIQDLLALTRAMLDPMDHIAWLAVLRAPWCGASLDCLETLVRSADSASLASVLSDCQLGGRWPDGSNPRVASTATELLTGMVMANHQGIAAAVSSTWEKLGGPACLGANASLRDAENFLARLAETAARPDWRGVQSLEMLTQDLYADAGEPTGLEVLTIHQAKGLEYDHVILVGLAMPWRGGDAPLLAWRELPAVTDDAGGLLLAVRPDADQGQDGSIYRFVHRIQKQREAQEKLRLLYVGATRAMRSLHWVASLQRDGDGAWRPPPTNSTLGLIWPVLADSFMAGDRLDSYPLDNLPDGTETKEPAGLQRLPDDWAIPDMGIQIDPLVRPAGVTQRESEPEFYWAGIDSRHLGTVLHAALHRLAVHARSTGVLPTQLPDDPAWQSELRALGVGPTQLPEAARQIGTALRATLADETGRWLLAPTHPEAWSEQPLTGVLDGELITAIIDRHFVDRDGQRWIIDYKSGRHMGGDIQAFLENEKRRYHSQITRYCRLLVASGQPARAALYFPFMQRIVYYEPNEH